jgi:hypothetical protein
MGNKKGSYYQSITLLLLFAPLTELELRNDKNLTQNLTQTSRRNNKGPTNKRKWLIFM